MVKDDIINEIAVLGCVRNPQAYTKEECMECIFNEHQCNAKRMACKVVDVIKKYQAVALSLFVDDLKRSLDDKIGYDNPYVMRHIDESKDRILANLDINKNTLIDTKFVVGQVVYTRGFFKGEIDEYIVKEVTYNHGKVSVYLQHEWDRDKTCYSATVYHEEDFDKLFTDRKELEALIKKESFVERVTCANASIVED